MTGENEKPKVQDYPAFALAIISASHGVFEYARNGEIIYICALSYFVFKLYYRGY